MHHEIEFEPKLKPLTVTIYPPEFHVDENKVASDWGFTCPCDKKLKQSCDHCGASMTVAFNTAAPESPQHLLHSFFRWTYEVQLGVLLPNQQHKCHPDNPSCQAARREG